MGVFTVPIKIKPLESSSPAAEEILMMVDTGAYISVVPRVTLNRIGVKPRWKRQFRLADGRAIEREVGVAVFAWNGEEGGAEVVFGEENDTAFLGAITLEAMALKVDMQKQALEPLGALPLLGIASTQL